MPMTPTHSYPPSENHGIEAMGEQDKLIYSVGISTAGAAEIRMAENFPDRKVIATTIDKDGILDTQKMIEEKGFGNQIETRLEDVSLPLPYTDNHFDFIYARLVLHSLSLQELTKSLSELYRILKPEKKLYIVVRSNKCTDANREGITYDDETKMTTGQFTNENGKVYRYSRYFQSPESISKHVSEAGFKVEYVKEYEEELYRDYNRTILVTDQTNELIELLATK